jgi:octaprenyl-diphosphate synthase
MSQVAPASSVDAPVSRAPVPSAVLRAFEAVKSDMHGVEVVLKESCQAPEPLMTQVAMHLVDAGGKRLRPLLTLLSARAAGVAPEAAVLVGAAAEMTHTASLLHDDVVDQSPLRRGRASAPQVHGNSACVLVGDALLAQSLYLLALLPDRRPTLTLARCVRAMARGELLQLATARGQRRPGLLGYVRVVEGKTSALLSWCTTVGELAPTQRCGPLQRFGRRLGLAFQIADDVLDYTGDPATTGKGLGADLREGKLTLPLLLADRARPGILAAASRLAAGEQDDPHALARLVARVVETGAPQQAQQMALTLVQRAHRSLEALPASRWLDHLHALTDFVVLRKR